jgi:outer membrane protein assembly factor BamB
LKKICYFVCITIIINLIVLLLPTSITVISTYNIKLPNETNIIKNYKYFYNFKTYDYKHYFSYNDYFNLVNIKLNTILIRNVNMKQLSPINSSWPMYCHDVKHSGQSPYNTIDNYGGEKWRFWTDYGIESSPAVDDNGVIYFGSLDDFLYALYPNGTEKWRFDCIDWISSSPAIADDGTIYIGSWGAHLYAVNPDGTEKWKFYTFDTVRSSPAIAEDGTIYFGVLGPGNNIGRFYALYPNGIEKWHFDTGFWIYESPAIGDDGTVYISSEDNHLYALYPDNGTMIWSFGFGDWPSSPSIDDDGTVYIASFDGYLYAIYPNGTLKWRHSIDWGTGNTPSIGRDGTIYVGGKYLYAVNPNGTRKWTFYCGNWMEVTTNIAVSNEGTLYFGASEKLAKGDIIAVFQNGTEKWRRTIADDWIFSSPAISSDGTIYIGSSSDNQGWTYGYLYAFGIKDLEADTNGPYYGLINIPVQFNGSSSGGYFPHSYYWNFGDTHTSDEQNPIHTYTNLGNYTVTLTVTDNTSNTTTDTTYAWIQETNTPPNKPTIDGPTNGNIKTSYPYTVSTSDPEESIIWYNIDWGDNTNTNWIGPYDSGKEITSSHTWTKKGTYILKVKAKDPYNSESLETILEVTIPRNKAIHSFLFLRFLERFPILQKLLNFGL